MEVALFEDEPKTRKPTERHEKNPFLEGMTIPKKDKQIKLSRLGKDDNVLINQATGEEQGTHITTYKKVDTSQFVKIFTQNVALTFDLSAAGIKTFGVLLWAVQNQSLSKDQVDLDNFTLDKFLTEHAEKKEKKLKLSYPTFRRGLGEIEKAKIVAKTLKSGRYFINPNFVFNGDRIAFTTLIERNNKSENDTPTLQ